MRKLASIRRVKEILPIKNADKIQLARIDGWQCVVAKDDNFKPNDLAVFFEIDSILPSGDPRWAFLESRHYRIKSMKMKGVLSQGLLVPLSRCPEIVESMQQEGTDVTEIMGVTKYSIPETVQLQGDTIGPYPSYILGASDEERLQNIPEVLDELKGNPYYITTKYDGTNATFMLNENNEFIVCSHHFILKESESNIYWKVARKYKIEEILRSHVADEILGKDSNIILRCELCGPGIQSNRYKFDEVKPIIFEIFDQKTMKFLNYFEYIHLVAIIQIEYNIDPANIIELGDSFNYTFDEMIEKSHRIYMQDCEYGKKLNLPIEGIVVRPQQWIYSNILHTKLSFKVINSNYLIKHNL